MLPASRDRRPNAGSLILLLAAALPALTAVARPASHPGIRLVSTDGRPESVQAALEKQMLALVARERSQKGLGALDVDEVLTRASRGHSREMCDRDFFDHLSPTAGRRTPVERYYREAGERTPNIRIGENIYFSSVIDAARAHQAFMNSPGHRENILHRGWKRIGIGVHYTPRGDFWVTQMFAG